MLNARVALTAPEKTWILVANRSGARIFEANGSLKKAKPVRDFQNPDGRLKSGKINSDRDGSAKAEAGTDYPMHGPVKKGKATAHVRQQFAKLLCHSLHKSRSEGTFRKLIVIAEPKLLGEIRSSLDTPTKSLIVHTLEKDWCGLDEAAVRHRLADLQPPN